MLDGHSFEIVRQMYGSFHELLSSYWRPCIELIWMTNTAGIIFLNFKTLCDAHAWVNWITSIVSIH